MMNLDVEILCPNCKFPITVTPDKSILEIIECNHCETKHDILKLKEKDRK